MTLDVSVITLALTAAGALPAALAIQFVIQVLKGVPQIATLLAGREKLFCLIAAYIVVVLAYAAALTAVPPTMAFSITGIIGLVLAGLNIARLAMASYDDFVAKEADGKRPSESILHPKGWVGEPAK